MHQNLFHNGFAVSIKTWADNFSFNSFVAFCLYTWILLCSGNRGYEQFISSTF